MIASRADAAMPAGGTGHPLSAFTGIMHPDVQAASEQIALAEAELAVLKQELVLQQLINTHDPTDAARTQLARLREAVARLMAGGHRKATKRAA